MPIEVWYLIALFSVVTVSFTLLKRPLYECMLLGFIVLVAITGTWSDVGNFIWEALQEDTLYVIFAFILSAELLSKTSVIDDCIGIILSLFGRLRGGAGFVAVIGSSYMGSLSGSGPGNVATTGVFTIPAMKRSGFPAHLAANVEAFSSTMGNMIPPAGMIGVAFGILDKAYPNTYTLPQYWMLLWGVALWFILQRIVTLYLMCLHYKVEPMEKAEIPKLKDSLKQGWKAVFLPIIVFVPFILTSQFEDSFTNALGAGAKAFSSSLLLIIPALIVLCGILLSNKKSRQQMTPRYMYQSINKGMLKVVPTAALVLFAYFVANVLEGLSIESAIGNYMETLNMSHIALSFIIPLICAILGMVLPGSSQVKIFGGIIIALMAGAGGNPMLAAAMLPCICGAMHGVTPPYCACIYTGMGIAQSELKPTLVNALFWLIPHYLLSALILAGWLPVWGLIG
ncbi:MAG: TRAP transporter large permease subunit [Ruminococcaceae bacterium]|nr:TRAP transporter large permease subunit [Oscillospiraceae bacterium]